MNNIEFNDFAKHCFMTEKKILDFCKENSLSQYYCDNEFTEEQAIALFGNELVAETLKDNAEWYCCNEIFTIYRGYSSAIPLTDTDGEKLRLECYYVFLTEEIKDIELEENYDWDSALSYFKVFTGERL